MGNLASTGTTADGSSRARGMHGGRGSSQAGAPSRGRGGQRVSIQGAKPVENPLVASEQSASDEGHKIQSAAAADPPQQQPGHPRLLGPVVTFALTALAAMWGAPVVTFALTALAALWGLLLWMLCAHSSAIFEMKAFWLCLIAAGAATLFMLGRTDWFKSFMEDHPRFQLALRCYQTLMCLAPVVDMGTDGLAAWEFAMDEEAPAWWLVFSLVVMGLTLRGAAVLKYYTTVLIAKREPHYGLFDSFFDGQGGSFSFAYIPLAFVPGLPWCCRQHSIYHGYTAADEGQKKVYTFGGHGEPRKPPPVNPWTRPLYTLLLGLCSELLLMPACLLAGPIIICREAIAAMPETFEGKVANPAAHPFADKRQVVLLLQFQFLDGAVEATPQTGLQIHAYLLGRLPAAVFFPSMAISLFNIMKTAVQFAENKELIRFVEEANSGHVSEGAARAYVEACSSVAEMDLSECNLGMEGAKGVAQAIKGHGAMTSLDISSNSLAQGNNWRPGSGYTDMTGIIALADGIKNNGALVKFDISNNSMRAEGAKALAEALKNNQLMQELNIASNALIYKTDAQSTADTDMTGVIAISDAIPTMGALASLDLSQNSVPASESGQIEAVCEAKSISLKI